MKRHLLHLLATLSLVAASLMLAPVAHASPLVAEMSVTIYEDHLPNNSDRLAFVDFPSNLHRPDLTQIVNSLHDGCNQGLFQVSSSWNDCISAVQISGMPAGWKVVFYVNTNYGFVNHTFCSNTTLNFGGVENDRTSSWRVESGGC